MNQKDIKFLFEIYTDFQAQKEEQAGEDYPMYDIDMVIDKIKAKIEEELSVEENQNEKNKSI